LKVPDNVKLYLRPMFNSNSYLFRLHNFDTKSPVIFILFLGKCNYSGWMESN